MDLDRLYEARWSTSLVVNQLYREKDIRLFVRTLSEEEKELLCRVVEDPDILWKNLDTPEAQKLLTKLVEMNMVMELWDRNEDAWVDIPPPVKDLDIGIGRYIARQTPLHREAVKKAIREEIQELSQI